MQSASLMAWMTVPVFLLAMSPGARGVLILFVLLVPFFPGRSGGGSQRKPPLANSLRLPPYQVYKVGQNVLEQFLNGPFLFGAVKKYLSKYFQRILYFSKSKEIFQPHCLGGKLRFTKFFSGGFCFLYFQVGVFPVFDQPRTWL